MKDSVPLAGNQQGVGDKEVSVGGIPSRKQMYVAILNLFWHTRNNKWTH